MENRSRRKHLAKSHLEGLRWEPGEELQLVPALAGQGGVLWRQLPAAPTPAASACCQNVWGWWRSNWRSYQLCGLPWSMAFLEMLLVPACCMLAVVQLPKMPYERIVPTLYLTLTVRHPITTASLVLWAISGNKARGGGKSRFFKWVIQYWAAFLEEHSELWD